ncbi:acyltransferase [Conexibacter sp. CPCC 206217]|uniref:acyltransferase family protein n=1 Tax=Conexibacter sp. CPCC 206217 TaxID=3064574 RepID=UPI00271E53BF|nr:acyltransferase [Conexibacter sp. CPCC 206217]MDO8209852.1 acyltransferase [Conexibacter sp. CPCC 206217]
MRYQPAFDGIRGIGILWVILGHTGRPAFGSAFYAVDLFFVLSGFLITTLLLEEFFGTGRISLKLFWQRRAVRLLPALAVLCVGVLLITLVNEFVSVRPLLSPFPDGTTLLGVLLSATYTASWGQALFHWNLGPMAHTWSLSVEEWYYLLWPLFLLVLLRWPQKLTRNLVVLAILAIVYRLVSEELITDKFYLYFAPDQRICQLLSGCALAAVLHEYGTWLAQFRRAVLAFAALGSIGVAVLMFRPISLDATNYGVPYEHDGVVLMALATSAMIGALVLRPQMLLAKALSFKPLLWIGRRSYGLYLYHYAAILIISPYTPPLGYVPWRSGIRAFIVMFVVAALSYRYVEQPALRWMRDRERRIRSAGQAAPQTQRPESHRGVSAVPATSEGSA